MENKNMYYRKESEYSSWKSNLILVRINNKFHICIDLRELNKAFGDVKYQLTTLEKILKNYHEQISLVFLMLKTAELDEQSSKLTSFWTPLPNFDLR